MSVSKRFYSRSVVDITEQGIPILPGFLYRSAAENDIIPYGFPRHFIAPPAIFTLQLVPLREQEKQE
jgi:hypothetical protein